MVLGSIHAQWFPLSWDALFGIGYKNDETYSSRYAANLPAFGSISERNGVFADWRQLSCNNK